MSRVAKQRITIGTYTILSTTNTVECIKKVRGVYLILQLSYLRLGTQ
jgi:hypothetical protein